MPNRSSRPLGALLALVAILLWAPAAASADDVVAQLRVLTPTDALEPGASYVTGTESLRTDPHARCFVGGVGGSGERVRMPGATALGLVRSALDWNGDLGPISTTDEFGFGLGVCGIGGKRGNEDRYWSLAVNHADPAASGDQVSVDDGDTVLWYLTGFPPPPELEIAAWPAGATPGSVQVSVVKHECTTGPPPDFEVTCATTPAEGAGISGGDGPAATDAGGEATVSVSNGSVELQATLGGDIPSNVAPVCVSDQAGKCPAPADPHGQTIYGRDRGDDFAGTAGWDRIKAGGGDDEIDLTDGGSDRVNCGAGHDRVTVNPGDDDDRVGGNCEKVAHA